MMNNLFKMKKIYSDGSDSDILKRFLPNYDYDEYV